MSADAKAALLGVVIGGLITTGTTVVLMWYQARKDVRAARRILRSQLSEAKKAVEDALKGRSWPPGWTVMGWSESWSTYRPALARSRMSKVAFDQIANAFLYLRLLQTGLAAEDHSFVHDTRSFLDEVSGAIGEAIRRLSQAAARIDQHW